MSQRSPASDVPADIHRWEVTAVLKQEGDQGLEDATLDHARDDVALLESLCSAHFLGDPSIYVDQKSSVETAEVDDTNGTLRVVVDAAEITPRMAALAFRRQVLPKYNEQTDREEIAGDLGLVGRALRTDEKPDRIARQGQISDEEWQAAQDRAAEIEAEADSAPDLQVDESTIHIRSVDGEASPVEVNPGA